MNKIKYSASLIIKFIFLVGSFSLQVNPSSNLKKAWDNFSQTSKNIVKIGSKNKTKIFFLLGISPVIFSCVQYYKYTEIIYLKCDDLIWQDGLFRLSTGVEDYCNLMFYDKNKTEEKTYLFKSSNFKTTDSLNINIRDLNGVQVYYLLDDWKKKQTCEHQIFLNLENGVVEFWEKDSFGFESTSFWFQCSHKWKRFVLSS